MKNFRHEEKSGKIYKLNEHEIKTTNINILLNRVRSSKRRDVKKKLFLTTIIFIILSLLSYIVFI